MLYPLSYEGGRTTIPGRELHEACDPTKRCGRASELRIVRVDLVVAFVDLVERVEAGHVGVGT
jgi:hypothetical protein